MNFSPAQAAIKSWGLAAPFLLAPNPLHAEEWRIEISKSPEKIFYHDWLIAVDYWFTVEAKIMNSGKEEQILTSNGCKIDYDKDWKTDNSLAQVEFSGACYSNVWFDTHLKPGEFYIDKVPVHASIPFWKFMTNTITFRLGYRWDVSPRVSYQSVLSHGQETKVATTPTVWSNPLTVNLAEQE